MSRTTARLSTNPVAIAACAIRQAMNSSNVGASSAPSVAATKMPVVASITGRLPNRSAIGPMNICIAAVVAR